MSALPREGERRCECGTVIAGDNPDDLCSPCQRAAFDNERRQREMTRGRVLAALQKREGEWVTSSALANELGLDSSTVLYHVDRLQGEHPIERQRGRGMRLLPLPGQDGGEPPAPPAPMTGASPSTGDAKCAAAPDAPPSGPPPFGGIEDLRVASDLSTFMACRRDDELVAIETCVMALEGFDRATVGRALAYLCGRFA